MKWYYERGSGQEGPVSLSVLQAMLASGDLEPTHKVWSKGLPDWTPASEVEALSREPQPEQEEASGPSELESAMAKLAAVSDEDGPAAGADKEHPINMPHISSEDLSDEESDQESESIEMPHITGEEPDDEEAELLAVFVVHRLSEGQDVDEIVAEIVDATSIHEDYAFGFVSTLATSAEEEEIGCLGWVGIIWVCGMLFAGCIRLCGG